MATDFTIKRHDQLPELATALKDSSVPSQIVNLTGTTIRFIMRDKGTGTVVLDEPATIIDPLEGTVKYTWQAGDTATAGNYSGEFEVNFAGRFETFPNSKHINIKIFEDLGGVGV